MKVVDMKKDLEVREKLVKDQIHQTEEEVKVDLVRACYHRNGRKHSLKRNCAWIH